MEAERREHAQAAQVATDRIRQLEDRLTEQDQKKFAKVKEERDGKTTAVTAAKTTSTTTATKTGTTTRTTTTTTTTTKKQTGSAASITSNGSVSGGSPNPKTPIKKEGESTPPATPNSGSRGGVRFSKKSQSQRSGSLTNGATALQHAWDKFCVRAKDDFTPKELSLMSLETIKSLLAHYNYSNPVEIAQIEAQWALIQDGEKAVVSPTPHITPSRRARSFSPMPVKEEFNLRLTENKPHLSKRSLLNPEPCKTGNPMSSCERHRDPSPQSKGHMLREAPLSCNPNEASPERYQKYTSCKRTLGVSGEFPFEHKTYPRGKSRSHSPNEKAIAAYPEETASEKRHGVKLLKQVPPYPTPDKGHGIRMVAPYPIKEEKKRSIRIQPPKDQFILG